MNMLHHIADRAGTATNLGLALALAAIIAVDTALTAAYHSNWLFELAIGLTVCILTLFRDRNRTWTAVSGVAVCGVAAIAADMFHLSSQPGFAATAALLVLGVACARVAPARPVIIIVVVGVAVMIAGRVTAKPAYFVALTSLGVLLWGAAIGVGLWLRFLDTRRSMAIDAARRDERLELARELHDVVAHHVAGIVVQAQAARVVATRRPETLEDTLAGIESAGTDALTAMRRVVGLLRDADDAAGLTPGTEQLGDLVDRFAGHGPAVELHLPAENSAPWPPEVSTTVYRIVQEALTNVVLHASGAGMVTVNVGDDASGVTVEVIDDAPQGPSWSTRTGGFGLIGMRERVEVLGGTLTAGPCPDGGWVVKARVPLRAGSTA